MTKTDACRRVALAALVAGAMSVSHEAGARTHWNGVSADGVQVAAGGSKPSRKANTRPNPQPTGKRAFSSGGVQVAAGGGSKPDTSGGPK